jgi:hypothetical protein
VLPFSITISTDQKNKEKKLVSVFYGLSMKRRRCGRTRRRNARKEGLCDAVPGCLG